MDQATDKTTEAARPSPQEIARLCIQLQHQGEALRRIPVAEICSVISRAAHCWLASDFRERRMALAELPGVTGFPRQAIETALDNLFGELAEEKLTRTVQSELGGPELLDLEARSAQPRGPRLTFHVLAGNLPGVGIFGLVAALLLKSPSLVKASSREPILADLFVRSLASVDSPAAATIAASVGVVNWKGGDIDREAPALAHAESVVAYGEAETIALLRQRAAGQFIPYGPRISIGLVFDQARERLRRSAREAALQVALFDQRGCLSPQFFLVESRSDPREFARLLASELRELSRALPRSPLSLDEAGGLRRFVERCRWKRASNPAREIYLDEQSLQWVVATGDINEMPPPMPGNRAVTVIPAPDLAAMVEAVRSLGGRVEAVGVAGPLARLRPLGLSLSLTGVSRACPLAKLQRPPFSWPQGGLPRLASLARWIGIEPPEEQPGWQER